MENWRVMDTYMTGSYLHRQFDFCSCIFLPLYVDELPDKFIRVPGLNPNRYVYYQGG